MATLRLQSGPNCSLTASKWMAWYEGGAVYSSDNVEWQELPSEGVQIVKIFMREEYEPGFPYTQTLDGKDWYYQVNGVIESIPSEKWGDHRPKPCGVRDCDLKRGTGVSDKEFARLTDLARQTCR